MAFDDPLAITGLSISALEGRRAQAGLLAHSDDVLSALPGVLHGFGCTVSSLTLTAAAGSAVVTPSSGSNGSYVVVSSSTATATIAAQDATYARIDRVVLRVYDTEVDASGYSKAAVEIITGTAAASPVAPTLPAGRLEIAQLQVPKSGTAITVVDTRLWAASVGGVITANSYATLPSGSWLRPGQLAYTLTGVGWRWNGTAWQVSGTPVVASETARNAAITAPLVGDSCITSDTMSEWRCLTAGSWTLWSRPWTTFTSTLTNATGTATITYRVAGGIVFAQLAATLTAAVTGTVTFTLPLTGAAATAWSQMGTATYIDTSASQRAPGTIIWPNTSGTTGYCAYLSSTTALSLTGAAAPFTWASGDQILANFSYGLA